MTGNVVRPEPFKGPFETAFWAYAAQDELRVQRCDACGALRYPPGPVCPDCLSDQFSWSPLSGRGTLLSWTIFHRQYFPGMPVPYLVAAIATAEGPVLIGNLIAAEGIKPRHGMACAVVFQDAVHSAGEFRIPQWQLLTN